MKPINQEYQYNRPAIFDWMVFTLSFLLGFIFPGLGDFLRSPGFAWWMLGVLVFIYHIKHYLSSFIPSAQVPVPD